MHSEMNSYSRHPGFLRDMPNIALQPPTALNKQLPWLHGDVTYNNHSPSGGTTLNNNESDNNDAIRYRTRPVRSWTYTDVIHFISDSLKELSIDCQDFNISKFNGANGEYLCKMSVEDFEKFTPKAGRHIYESFMRRREEEKMRAASHVTSSHQDSSRNHRMPHDVSSYEYPNHPSNTYHLTHHPHSHPHPQPVLMQDSLSGCDASAPYEVRYETVDARSIGFDDGSRRLYSGGLPSASGKSFDLLHAPSPAAPFDMDGNISDPDVSSNEEEVKLEPPPKKRGPGRPRKPENELKKKRKKTGRLWEFIRNLLLDPVTCPSMVKWENAEEGVFRFVQAEKVAQKWGERKQNKEMNYEKLSRAMRYYYKGEVFEAVLGRRLVYKFGKNAKDWRPSNPNFVNHVPYSQSSSH